VSLPRIVFWLENNEISAFYAISGEFSNCGRASSIGYMPPNLNKKRFRFNDQDFICVYNCILRVMDSDRYRYRTNEGHEYDSLKSVQQKMQAAFHDQRGKSIR
jgi:hypothetical protein